MTHIFHERSEGKIDNKHTHEDLKIMQSWSLEQKIKTTQTRIMEFGIHFDHKIYVSSG